MPDVRPERERALQVVEQIRTALASDDLQVAIRQIDTLQDVLVDWKRSEARQWLDEALRGELLIFNVEAANQRLAQWRSTLTADISSVEEREFTHYKDRVQERSTQKQMDLQARGVVSHCEELWRKAADLERGEQPPHPDYAMTHYYIRSRDIATAAAAEHPKNATLDLLVQQCERLVVDKGMAARLYRMALEEGRYGEALAALDRLSMQDMIPRFRVMTDPTSREMTTFDRMVSHHAAREEIDRLARLWAADNAITAARAAESALEAYRAHAALEALANRDLYEAFLREDDRLTLRELDRRAQEALRLLEQSERRARQAQRLADENAVGAWNLYVEAYEMYPGTPVLPSVREVIVGRLYAQLAQTVTEAEQTFVAKHMDRVQLMYQDARVHYGEKDPSLDPLLARFEEINWQAQTYQEYLSGAVTMLGQIQELIWRDIVQAGELLGQLEAFPPIVLEELDGLAAVRAEVRQRLNREMLYNQLYKLLLSTTPAEIERGIGAAQQQDEPRFRDLRTALELHLGFLMARQEYLDGRPENAMARLSAVAAVPGHPDRAAAQDMIDDYRAAPAASPSATDGPPE